MSPQGADATGRPIVVERLEKRVDVFCALAPIHEARDPNIDVVILATQDTDLEATLDEALSLGTAKVETASSYDNVDRSSH